MAHSTFQTLKHNALNLWQARAPREQLIIACASLILLGAVVFLTVYEPAAQGIAQLQASLPSTQAQALQIEQLTQQLQSQAKPVTNDFATAAGIQHSLDTAGIQAKVSASAPWQVTITSATAQNLWQWLKIAPVSNASFKRNPQGVWQGSATVVP